MGRFYIALSQTQCPPKYFTFCLTFTHSLTHSYTMQGAIQLVRSWMGLGVLLMATSTLG